MRKIVFLIAAVLCFQPAVISGAMAADEKKMEGVITVSGAWALYPMAVKWADEFKKIYPDVKIDITAGGAGKGMADALSGVVDIGMVSRDVYKEEIDKGAWWVAVTKDAVVPTISADNPFLDDILKKGAKKDAFIGVWIREDVKYWEDLLGGDKKSRINAYTRSDACGAAEVWAKYLGKKQEDLKGVGVYGDPGIAEAVRNDIFGIGFNNINFAYDPNTKEQIKGIKIMPIDLNENGQIDTDEDFYANRDGIVNAIALGKYPSPPARDLYFVSKGKPAGDMVIKFLQWVLTDGQKYVSETGYIQLSAEKLREQLDKTEAR